MKRIVVEPDSDGVIGYVSGTYYLEHGEVEIEEFPVHKCDVSGEEMWAYECGWCGNEFVSKESAEYCPACGGKGIVLLG
jgi:DNA-directed RNA polymerase subunit RPC12/RpoP